MAGTATVNLDTEVALGVAVAAAAAAEIAKGVKVGMPLVTGMPGRLDCKPGMSWAVLEGPELVTPFAARLVRASETVFVTAVITGVTWLAKGPEPLTPSAGVPNCWKKPMLACNRLS